MSRGSFLKRAGEHLGDLRVQLDWGDDTVSEVCIGDEQSDDHDVRFLSQKFVERLCSDDHIGTELVSEIEAVVFSYLDPTDTLNASSFDELRALRTESIRSEGQRLRDEVVRLIREECSLRDNAEKLGEKKTRIKTLSEERAGLIKQMPKAGVRRGGETPEQTSRLVVEHSPPLSMQQPVRQAEAPEDQGYQNADWCIPKPVGQIFCRDR